MRNLIFGMLIGLLLSFTLVACSMGSKRMRGNIDPGKLFWVPCTSKMVAVKEGKLCVPNYCVKWKNEKQKKCEVRETLVKDLKVDHEFFELGNFIMIPENLVF